MRLQMKERLNMKRRDFFRRGLPSYIYKLGSGFVEEAGIGEDNREYFDSFESAYPFLSEVSMEMLYQAAAQVGIDPTGKSKLELAKEVYERRGLVYHDG